MLPREYLGSTDNLRMQLAFNQHFSNSNVSLIKH
jgi:hypothetical protein